MNRISNNRLIFLVFGFFFIINITSNGGHFDSYDGIETFLVTESMVLHHSAKLYPDVPSAQKLHFDIINSIASNKAAQGKEQYNYNTTLEPVYIWRSLLLSALAVPFYYAAILFSVSPIPVVAIFVNPLILALTSVVIFCFSLELHESKKIAFLLSLIFGVCSFAWSYTTTLFPQPLQALLIITSAFFIFKSIKQHDNNNFRNAFAILGGLLLGFSLFAHPTSAIVIPAFVGYSIFSMWRNKRKSLLAFLIMLGIAISSVGIVNYWRFGSLTEFGYGNQGSLSYHHGWKGLLGLLISPGKGIIFFFPVVILLPIALKYMHREDKGLFFLFCYVILGNWLYFGTDLYPTSDQEGAWTGTIGWGPRYLVPILPFITIALGYLLANLKSRLFLKFSIITLCVVSFFVSLLGTIVWYQYGQAYGWDKEGLWQYDHITFRYPVSYNVSSWEVMTWFPQYSPIIFHMKILMSNYLSNILQARSSGESKTQIAHDWAFEGLAPCQYDIYLYCKAGVTPILLLSCIEVGIGTYIVLEIYYKPNTKLFLLRFKK